MKNIKNLSDEALVDLVRGQDQELYREIVLRYQDKLLRYATYLVGDEHQAADIVQEGFIKAFINLQGFDIRKKFSSWLYRIVHNEAINFLKKHAKEISLSYHQGIEESITSPENIEKDFSQKEIQKMIRKNLDQLPLKYRSPLILFYLEDHSYEEISDILHLPVGTIGTQINRGKKAAYSILKANGGDQYV